MFDDLLGNIGEHQKEMQEKLSAITVQYDANGVTIIGNAARQITDIKLTDDIFSSGDKEMVQDLILDALNKFIEKQMSVETEESQKFMESMLPPGFGNLFK
ncbi:MAG: YbaB/EbfC family nucleoid-associated protein [Saprospiraceae bacterium]